MSSEVWIFSQGEDYAGNDIEGVFEAKEDALRAVREVADLGAWKVDVDTDKRSAWSQHDRWMQIERWEVEQAKTTDGAQ